MHKTNQKGAEKWKSPEFTPKQCQKHALSAKKYGDADRVNGGFGAKWGEAFDTGLFSVIENATGKENFFEDCEAYIGLMRCKDGEPFQYWVGMFTKEDTPVPEGLEYVDFPASEIGIGWIYGNEGEIYCHEPEVAQKLAEEGHEIKNDENGACWFFERYQCPRYTTPDEKGNVVLDIVFFITQRNEINMEKITHEGALVKVRRFSSEDWKDVREIAESKESSAFAACDVPWKTDEDSAREMADYMATDSDMWAVEAREEKKVICFVNFNGVDEEGWLDIGHVMNEKYAKRGLENEGLKLLYNYAFETMEIAGIRAYWALDDIIKLAPLFSLGMTVTAVNENDWFDGREGKFMGCELRVSREDFYRVRDKNDTEEFDSRCGLHCTGCSFKESHGCGGCIATCGRPFHGECPVAVCCQEKGFSHCGECGNFPCALMKMYASDDVAEMGWSRISECEKWRAKE